MRRAVRALAVALAALSVNHLASQEEPAEDDSATVSPYSAAAWCAVSSGDDDSPGCDGGGGVSLAKYKRLRWVVVIGSKTIGSGLAWVPEQKRDGRLVFAVAAGVVVKYDPEAGVDAHVYPAIGMTVGFGRH